jgi:hypothetical protein
VSDHLFVAEPVDRVLFARRVGDGRADSAGIGRREQLLGQPVQRV